MKAANKQVKNANNMRIKIMKYRTTSFTDASQI